MNFEGFDKLQNEIRQEIKNLLPDFFFIYGEKKKACKSEKQALARLFYFRKGCEHSGKKKDKETPV